MNRGSSRFSAFARYYVDHLGELTSGEKNPSILRNMSGFLPLEVVKGVAEIFETFAEQFYSSCACFLARLLSAESYEIVDRAS